MDSLVASLVQHGVLLVGLNVFLQQLGLPIPAVPTMIVAGAMAAGGSLWGAGAFAISVAASVVADLLWYAGGRRYGYSVLKFLCRVSLSPDTCVRQTENIFGRYGFTSVVVSKFVPGFSTVAPPVAGALRMGVAAFLAAAVASAALWVGAAMATGWILRAQVQAVLAWMTEHAVLAAFVVGAALAAWVMWKAFQRWRLARQVAASLITVDELAGLLERGGRAHLVDVGSKLAHAHRPRIPGAVVLDLDEIDARASEFPSDRDIVLYCQCPNEASARRAAQILLAHGYSRVRPLVGGLDAWMAAGGRVEGPREVVIEPPRRAA